MESTFKKSERDSKKTLLMQKVALKNQSAEDVTVENMDGVARDKLRKLSSNLSAIASSREDLESAKSQQPNLKEDEKFDTSSIMNNQMRGVRTNRGLRQVLLGVKPSQSDIRQALLSKGSDEFDRQSK